MNQNYWNPWHGCHKCSPGCANCYVYYLDGIRGRNATQVVKSKTGFDTPTKKDRNGNYKLNSRQEVYTCFTSDFFVEEADEWRPEACEQVRARPDLRFLIPTKRIERVESCFPDDWEDGFENVIIAVSCENQEMADRRIPKLLSLPAKKKYIFAAPLLDEVNIEQYLHTGGIDLVSACGESYPNARECRFEWVEKLFLQCRNNHTGFTFHQTGANFWFNGKHYNIPHSKEHSQAQKAMEYLKKKYKTYIPEGYLPVYDVSCNDTSGQA